MQNAEYNARQATRLRRQYLRNLWYWASGLPEPPITLEVNPKKEWSPLFETLMRNRLLMGAFRYGPLSEHGKPSYEYAKCAIKRIELFLENGNLEHLVDAANLCLLEFVDGRHPLRHFSAKDEHNNRVTIKSESST